MSFSPGTVFKLTRSAKNRRFGGNIFKIYLHLGPVFDPEDGFLYMSEFLNFSDVNIAGLVLRYAEHYICSRLCNSATLPGDLTLGSMR